MGNKRIITFFFTGIALCLVILLVGRNGRRVLVVPDKRASLLFREGLDDLTAIVIERGGQRIEIRYDGARWSMLAPVEASVDQGVVSRLLHGFEGVVVEDRLSFDELRKRGLSVADYGLHPARARIAFQKPGRELSILFGGFSATDHEVYVRKNNLEQVLAIPRQVFEVIPEDANALRSRQLIDCDRALVSSIDIRRPGHPFIRLVKESGAWLIEQPISARASAERVNDFLDNFFEVRVFKFAWPTLDNVMDVADFESALKMRKGLYGLDDETGTTIQVYTLDGGSDSKVVIGRRSEKAGEPVYALMDDSTAIGVVSNSFADIVSVTSFDFRSMRVFEDITKPLSRLQLMQGEELFVLSQTNGLWRIDAPASEPADQEAVRRAIQQMLALKAERVVTGAAKPEFSENDGDWSYVEFSAGDQSAKVSVKKPDLAGSSYMLAFADSTELFFVAASNMPPVMVEREVVMDLRDKTLLSLSSKSINRVTIKKYGTIALSVAYAEADGTWHPSDGELKGKLNSEAFAKVLELLTAFRADKVVKIGMSVADSEYYGFKEPWLEVNLDVDIESAVRKTLLVGRAAGFNLRYVMLRGDQSVFTVDEQRLDIFTEGLFMEDGRYPR
ncbi:MAG: DUF4340 domain-containing protein [Kiritimatiellia bacterium]